MDIVNVLIASVGGQGGLTLSRILATAAIQSGLSVRTGETLGMAQRYGSVVSYVRIGREVYSPLFGPGEANYLLGLELTETLRNLHYLSSSGVVIVADEYRASYLGSINTPGLRREELITRIRENAKRAFIIPAKKIALETGNPRALNMVILGVFIDISKIFSYDVVEEAITSVLPQRVVESSIWSFKRGIEYSRQYLQLT